MTKCLKHTHTHTHTRVQVLNSIKYTGRIKKLVSGCLWGGENQVARGKEW